MRSLSSLNAPTSYAGLFNVPAYQVSGKPWVTSSFVTSSQQTEINFPYVTNFYTLMVSSSVESHTVNVAYASGGFNTNNYFTLEQGDTFSANVAVSDLYLKSVSGSVGFQIHAGLTNINADEAREMWNGNYMSGSGIHGTFIPTGSI